MAKLSKTVKPEEVKPAEAKPVVVEAEKPAEKVVLEKASGETTVETDVISNKPAPMKVEKKPVKDITMEVRFIKAHKMHLNGMLREFIRNQKTKLPKFLAVKLSQRNIVAIL
jgi:hypothetical protein